MALSFHFRLIAAATQCTPASSRWIGNLTRYFSSAPLSIVTDVRPIYGASTLTVPQAVLRQNLISDNLQLTHSKRYGKMACGYCNSPSGHPWLWLDNSSSWWRKKPAIQIPIVHMDYCADSANSLPCNNQKWCRWLFWPLQNAEVNGLIYLSLPFKYS